MPDLLPPSGDDGEPPSKSARKREMTARQALGEALCNLSPRELATIPIESNQLLEAIAEVKSINSHSARKRHLQYIGKIMRDLDPLPLQTALDALHGERNAAASAFQELEALRDRLLDRGDAGLEEVLVRWPAANRQQLRQLLRQHAQEVATAKPAAASRRLFRYLRELQEGSA